MTYTFNQNYSSIALVEQWQSRQSMKTSMTKSTTVITIAFD